MMVWKNISSTAHVNLKKTFKTGIIFEVIYGIVYLIGRSVQRYQIIISIAPQPDIPKGVSQVQRAQQAFFGHFIVTPFELHQPFQHGELHFVQMVEGREAFIFQQLYEFMGLVQVPLPIGDLYSGDDVGRFIDWGNIIHFETKKNDLRK